MGRTIFKATLYVCDDENDFEGEVELEFPGKPSLCGSCRGTGVTTSHVDGNGLTSEDFDRDPDFRDDYLAGVYDRPCSACHGQRTVIVPDEEAMNAGQRAQLAEWREFRDECARNDAEDRHARRMESGGSDY